MARRAGYDEVAPRYDRRYQEESYPGTRLALHDFLRSSRQLDVLEVGCGTGHWLGELEGRTGRIVGLDPSSGMLERATQAARRALLVQGRAEALPLKSRSFDRVFCVNAFHHFEGRASFLHEARRVLRPGGGLMTVGLDPHAEHQDWWLYDYFRGVLESDKRRYPSVDEIQAATAEATFVRCESRQVEHIVRRVSAGEAWKRGLLDRSATSQLMILSEGEYREGLESVRAAMVAAGREGGDLVLAANLRLFATTAWVE